MNRPHIDPALGLDLVKKRTLERRDLSVTVLVPAHNEQDTIAEIVTEALKSLSDLKVDGEVIVSASACTDATADLARRAGATVVESPVGKGAAILAALSSSKGDVICLIDGDFSYHGDEGIAALLVSPILGGLADATIADLYWRPLYPQLWLYGFFAPLVGTLFPELLGKAGTTPWSGQRAALRTLWPKSLPEDFTVDLALLLHWNDVARRLRPVLADDWTNPQRPKPELIHREHAMLTKHAVRRNRISADKVEELDQWFDSAHTLMAEYRPGHHDPEMFEKQLLEQSLNNLRRALATGRAAP